MRILHLGRGLALLLFLAGAVLEVAGDALIRKGLRGEGMALAVLGFFVIGCYGIAVNLLPFDFSRLLGAYVGVFALAGVSAGRLFFGEEIPTSTWLGLAVILVGSAIIHLGGQK